MEGYKPQDFSFFHRSEKLVQQEPVPVVLEVDKIIRSNYGFAYDKNLFKIFCTVVGSSNWENIMDSLPAIESQNFENITNSYSPLRNQVAHTHTLGSTPTYRAPSVILADFLKLWPAMQSVESKIQAISS